MVLWVRRNWQLLLLLSVYALFNVLLINRFFPITEGWFQDYARYMTEGFVPYKDFYCPVPPGFIYLNYILRQFFGDVFIYYRIYGLIERLAIVAITYSVFRRFLDKEQLFIAILTASIIYIANIQDIFYGYYQTSFLFATIILYSVIKMYENYSTGSKLYFWSIIFGITSAVSFLFKQTIGGLLPIFLGLAFVVLTIRIGPKKTIISGLLSLCSAMFILLMTGLLLLQQDALIPCINQIFLGAKSKGSFESIFFGFFPRMLTKESITILILSIFTSATLYFKKYINNKEYKYIIDYIPLVLSLYFVYILFIKYLKINCNSFLLLCMYICGVLLLSFLCKKYEVSHKEAFLVVTLVLLVSFLINSKYCGDYIDYHSVRRMRQHLIYALFYINLLCFIIETIRLLWRQFEPRRGYIYMVLCTSLAMMYTHGLSYIVEDHGTLLLFALTIGLAFNYNLHNNTLKNISVCMLCVLMILTIFVQRVQFPYHWWGVNDVAPVCIAKSKYDDPNLRYFFGEKSTVKTMNEIYNTIEKLKKEGDTMYCFPHINYFNVMSNLDSPTFSKVHYFDVCPDNIIYKDVQRLINQPPTFAVIQKFNEKEWEIHENAFRGGNFSGQREIIKLFDGMIKSGEYRIIKRFQIYHSNEIIILQKN